MSFALTTAQILDRSKTVTRRTGWSFLKPGDRIQAVRKGMGLRKGEQVERLAVLEVVSVSRWPLAAGLTARDVEREGFPGMTPAEFVAMFCKSHKGCTPATDVARIAFRYVDGAGR